MLLYDFGEILTLDIFFKELPNNSFNVVFPQLPVIAIILVFIFFLKIIELLVKNFKESLTLTWRVVLFFLLILLTMVNEAFFFYACSINLLPSFFLPLIAKKISFFLISLELILACLKLSLEDILLFPDNSLSILNFKLFDKTKFFFFYSI